MLDLARSGRVTWEVEELLLEQANMALDRPRRGEIAGGAVLRR